MSVNAPPKPEEVRATIARWQQQGLVKVSPARQLSDSQYHYLKYRQGRKQAKAGK